MLENKYIYQSCTFCLVLILKKISQLFCTLCLLLLSCPLSLLLSCPLSLLLLCPMSLLLSCPLSLESNKNQCIICNIVQRRRMQNITKYTLICVNFPCTGRYQTKQTIPNYIKPIHLTFSIKYFLLSDCIHPVDSN